MYRIIIVNIWKPSRWNVSMINFKFRWFFWIPNVEKFLKIVDIIFFWCKLEEEKPNFLKLFYLFLISISQAKILFSRWSVFSYILDFDPRVKHVIIIFEIFFFFLIYRQKLEIAKLCGISIILLNMFYITKFNLHDT